MNRQNSPTDVGSSLPLLLFGVAFLVALSGVCLAGGQLLQQQRRLNGAADTVALDLVVSSLAVGADSDTQALLAAANRDIADLYPNVGLVVADVASPQTRVAQVRLCGPAVTLFQGLGKQTVCATSRAGAL